MSLKNRIIGHFTNDELPLLSSAAGGEIASPPPLAEAVPPLTVRALSEPEREWLQKIHQRLMEMIDLSQIGRLDKSQARNKIRELAERIMDELTVPLNISTRQFLAKCIEDEILGLGPLEPLLVEPSIADILVNGSGKIFVERFGKLELTPLRFQNDAHLLNIIDEI
ncbi:MAG: hypothetical protein ACXWT1_04865 [Methylobacter sp.]